MGLRKDLSSSQQVKPAGSSTEVQLNVSGSFTTDPGFTFNTSTHSMTSGGSNVASGSYATVTGLNNTILGSWTIVGGESHTSTLTAGDNAIFGISNVAGNGINSFSGNGGITAGVDCHNYGLASHVSGCGAQVSYVATTQRAGFAHAFQVGSVDGLKPSTVPYLLVNDGAGAISRNTASQTGGHGSLAQDGFILGGIDGNIPSDSPRSIILGGNAIKARSADSDQVYVPNFNIVATPLNDDTLTQVLVRNSTTGQIKYRSSLTLGGSGGTWGSITGTLSSQTDLQSALNLKANRYLTLNTQTTNYTLTLTDSDTKAVETNLSVSNNVTIPPNSSVAFSIGTQIPIVQYGVGLTTIVPGSGVVVRSSSGVLTSPGQYSTMFLIKRATDEWYLLNGVPSFTNSAVNTELIMSNGTNGVSSNVFSSSGSLTLGSSATSGSSRNIIAAGSSSDIGFTIQTKGIGYIQANVNSIRIYNTTGNSNIVIGNGLGQQTILAVKETTDGSFLISSSSGTSSNNSGDNLNLRGGSAFASAGNGNGGSILIQSGGKRGTGVPGNITIDSLGGHIILSSVPTSSSGLPSGSIWSNSGVLNIVP